MPRTSSFASSLVVDAEVMEDVMREFESLRTTGKLPREDVRKAFEIAGLPITGIEFRDLMEREAAGVDFVTPEMFAILYCKVREMKDFGRNFRQEKVLKEKKDLTVHAKQDTHTAKHTISHAEQKGYASWINRVLAKDDDCRHHLPVNGEDEEEIYDKCKDGLIICKLINKAVKDTIDRRILNRGASLKSVFKRNENLMLAVNSAESIGCCVVNIGPGDIANGTKHLVLGLVWQVIRIGLLSGVNLANHKELAALLREGETLNDLRRLSPEELLLRWVNYHLARAGVERQITNFKEDIMDSEIYANLIQQIAPMSKQCELIPVNKVVAGSDHLQRADRVLKNAAVLEADLFVLPEDIAYATERNTNRDKLNLAFVANLFNNYPALEAEVDIEIEETLEMKTYRNWMNSMGVKPYVTDLIADLQNGLVLLQMFDHLKPGVVEWKKVVQKFDPRKQKFQMLGNCTQVVECAKKCDLKVLFSAENILDGDEKFILGLCFQMMRAYTLKILSFMSGGGSRIEDAEILKWANQRLQEGNSKLKVNTFRDGHLSDGKAVLHLLESINQGSVDFDLVCDDDNMANCKLAVGLARRAGARVYALPEHLHEVNKNMVMTIFATIMIRHHELQKQALEG